MNDGQLDSIFKALSDCTRRRIINQLRKQPAQSLLECAALAAENGVVLSRQTISQHLSVLESAGLVQAEWKGRIKAHYLSITDDHIKAASWLTNFKPKGT